MLYILSIADVTSGHSILCIKIKLFNTAPQEVSIDQ